FPEDGYVQAVAVSPDGKILAGYNEGSGFVRLWEVDTGRPMRPWPLAADAPRPGGLCLSLDGKVLVAAAWQEQRREGAIYFWELATGKQLRKLDCGGAGVGSPTFSPDGRFLVAGGAGGVRVWDVRTGEEVAPNDTAHRASVTLVAMSPQGTVATAGDDYTVCLWDAVTGRQRKRFPIGHRIQALAFSPDGTYLAASSLDDAVHVWDTRTNRAIYKLAGHGKMGGRRALTFTSDGKRLLSWG